MSITLAGTIMFWYGIGGVCAGVIHLIRASLPEEGDIKGAMHNTLLLFLFIFSSAIAVTGGVIKDWRQIMLWPILTESGY